MINGIITQEVVYKSNKGTPVTDSLKVAQVFGKLHKNVMKSIRGLAQNLADRTWFYETTYQDARDADLLAWSFANLPIALD